MTIIEKRVCLDAKYFSSDILKHLTDKIKIICKDECTQEYGYITKVNGVTKIKNQYISPATTNLICIVEVDVDTIKPKEDDILSGKICGIYSEGILIEIKSNFNIFISKKEIKEYTFNQYINTYVQKDINTNKIISQLQIEDIITFKILGVRYSSKKFDCFGTFISKN